jgi:hypothetical protein
VDFDEGMAARQGHRASATLVCVKPAGLTTMYVVSSLFRGMNAGR